MVVKFLLIALAFTLSGCDYRNKLIDGRKTADVVVLSANGEIHEYIWLHDKHYNTSGLAHLPNCSTCQRRKELFEQTTWRTCE